MTEERIMNELKIGQVAKRAGVGIAQIFGGWL